MKLPILLSVAAALCHATAHQTYARSAADNITYLGVTHNDIEHFLGIRYAQDTGGVNRFKPPRPFAPAPGSTINATNPGPACPQPLGQTAAPLALGNVTEVSEDCLTLNIARPKINGGPRKSAMAVMLWIHGGGFWSGSNMESTTDPDGLIRQSVKNSAPVMHVAINYRLGFFGFAQSETLKKEVSENAGLRDQRLAIEWVRDNIARFGGDPDKITIFGQSSGGLAIGMQILAYGGKKALPFQQGIAQSQALEPGITANFTIDAMTEVANYVGCNSTSVHSPETVECLRQKDTSTLLQASIATHATDIGHNIGDIWLPVVDGDFLPAPPSQLIAEGSFGKTNFMTGWTEDDLDFYTNTSIVSVRDTYNFIRAYLPGLTESSLKALLDLYPSSEFVPGTALSSEFYRSSRIFRDVLMVCPSLYLGRAVATTHLTPVFYYNFNQTVVAPLLDTLTNTSGLGVGHTSEFAYVFDSFQAYTNSGFQVHPSQSDLELMKRASGSWSSFATRGQPSCQGSDFLCPIVQGWKTAYEEGDGPYIMTIGGPQEKLSPNGGPPGQRLEERCRFLNSPDIIKALGY